MPYAKPYGFVLGAIAIAFGFFWPWATGAKTNFEILAEWSEYLLLTASLVGFLGLEFRVLGSDESNKLAAALIPLFFATIAALGLQLELVEAAHQSRVLVLGSAFFGLLVASWFVLAVIWWRTGRKRWDTVGEALSAPMLAYVLIAAGFVIVSYFFQKWLGTGPTISGLQETMDLMGMFSFAYAMLVAHWTFRARAL